MQNIDYRKTQSGASAWLSTHEPEAEKFKHLIRSWEWHNEITNADLTLCEFSDWVITHGVNVPIVEYQDGVFVVRCKGDTLKTCHKEVAELFYTEYLNRS